MQSTDTPGNVENIGKQLDESLPPKPPSRNEARLTADELKNARLTPDCIVQDYLYADVAVLTAPGGTGKTTQVIHENICIVLGLPVHGMPVKKSGWTLFVTAEDRREQLAARTNEIMKTMQLDDESRRIVMDGLIFWDVTGEQVKLISSYDGNIMLTNLADDIIEAYRDDPPVLVIFDPIVSFGASEGQINDNEQGIITAVRRIIRALNCCVRVIAHTGKGNAREKTLDQYTSRGGSALSDGSRMVAVLQSWTPGDPGNRQPPFGCTATTDSSLTILARPKLSYAKPNLPMIWIRRTGWLFEHFAEIQQSREDIKRANADQVALFIKSQLSQGNKHTRRTLESSMDGLTRAEIRAAVDALTVESRLIERLLPKDERQGQRKSYLDIHCAENKKSTGAIVSKITQKDNSHD